jgi:4-amino-4-deoxy-L-arabinose transferase-like glycosyltransferase
MIGTMIGWITYPIGREMFGNRSGKISMLIATFYPSLIRWSIANLKDPMTAFSFLVCVYILVCAVKTRIAVWKYLLLFFFMAVLFLFPHRFYFVLVAAGAALAASLRLFALLGRIVSKKALAVMVVIALLAAAFYIFYVKPEPLIQLIYKCEDKQYTISRSDYAGYHLYPNTFMGSLCKGKVPPLEFFEVICLNTAYFMLTPFPWQMTSRERLAAYPQILAWYLILFLSVFGFAMLSFKKPRVASLVGTLLAVGIVFSALAEGNIGAAFRHRDVFTPFFIILAAAVLEDLFYGDAEVSSPSMGAKA